MIPAKYTIVLKTILDNPETKALIDKAMSTYQIYTPVNEVLYGYIPTREELNEKILSYYKYREIGFETIGRFIDELEISLKEIMPYYNQLYKSVDVLNELDNIFGNVDMMETFEETSEGSTKGSSEGSSESHNNATDSNTTEANINNYNKNVTSSTPQGQLEITNKNIDSVTYADSVTWNHDTNNDSATSNGESNQTSTNETSASSEAESNSKTSHTLHRKGNHGVNTYAHDMLEFRELFINIEQQIIHDKRIAELFMTIY